MVLITTVLPIPLTCIATGGVSAQGQPLPSPSSLLHLHPPPPHPVPPVHGHVLPQLCYQTTLPTAPWAPWFLHHESRAGRFVLLLGLDEQFIPLLPVNSWFNMQALFSFYCCWMYEYILVLSSFLVTWRGNIFRGLSKAHLRYVKHWYWHVFLYRTGLSQVPMTSPWSIHWGERKTRRPQL